MTSLLFWSFSSPKSSTLIIIVKFSISMLWPSWRGGVGGKGYQIHIIWSKNTGRFGPEGGRGEMNYLGRWTPTCLPFSISPTPQYCITKAATGNQINKNLSDPYFFYFQQPIDATFSSVILPSLSFRGPPIMPAECTAPSEKPFASAGSATPAWSSPVSSIPP